MTVPKGPYVELMKRPHAVHMMATALMGKTAEHLQEVHGIAPTDDVRKNAKLHMLQHAE